MHGACKPLQPNHTEQEDYEDKEDRHIKNAFHAVDESSYLFAETWYVIQDLYWPENTHRSECPHIHKAKLKHLHESEHNYHEVEYVPMRLKVGFFAIESPIGKYLDNGLYGKDHAEHVT